MLLLAPPNNITRHPIPEPLRRSLVVARVQVREVPWVKPALHPSIQRTGGVIGAREFMKLHAFSLTEYAAVLYLDLDVLVTGDVSPLLDCAANGTHVFTPGVTSMLNAGVWAVRPDLALCGPLLELP